MNLFLLRVKAFFRGIYRKIKMNLDFLHLRNSLKSTKKAIGIKNGKSIILAPHADDEWVGCSQVLNKKKHNIICFMDMHGGDTEDIHKLRFNEMKNIAKKEKTELIVLNGDYEKKVQDLNRVIVEKKPDNIFLPFFYDWHDDHIKVITIFREALKRSDLSLNVCMYQVSVPIPEKKITHVLPMTKSVFQHKWNVFDNIYKSQLSIPWIRFRYNERISGAISNSYASEVFSCMNSADWLDVFEKEMLTAQEKQSLINNLQDLKKIRITVESIYMKRKDENEK